MKKVIQTIFCLIIPFYMFYAIKNPSTWHFIDNIDLIFHEAGHTIFFFLPLFLTILAGSVFQVLVPLVISIYFFMKREFISSSIILSYVGQSIVNVSVYAKDAAKMDLPLLGGESVIHDWNYLLSHLRLLPYTAQIGSAIYIAGLMFVLTSIFLCIYLNFKNNKVDTSLKF